MSIPTHARICPFCRKSFDVQGIRRLHLAPVEATDKDRETALLERFLLAVDSKDPSELEGIVEEVDAWLEQGKGSLVLEKAHDLFTRHQQLKAQRKQYRKDIKSLNQTVQQLEGTRMGGSTVGEIRELRRRAKQDRLLIEDLQEQLYGPRSNNKGKAKETWTPLPTPPDILPFDYQSQSSKGGAGASWNPPPTPSDRLPSDDPPRNNKGKGKEVWNPLPTPPDMSPFDDLARMLRDALEHDEATWQKDGQTADHLYIQW